MEERYDGFSGCKPEESMSMTTSIPHQAIGMKTKQLLTVILPGAFWAWLFLACAEDWTTSENYSYGWLAAALAIYFLWKRVDATKSIDKPAQRLSLLCWGILAICALAVLPLEVLRQTPIYWRVFHWGIFVCVVGATLASAYLSGGGTLVRAVVFPLLFLATAVPWPTLIEQPITLSLMNFVASRVAEVLPLFGVPVQQQGTTLILPNCVVGVEEACSGIRSLQSAVMLGVAFGELFELGILRRLTLLVMACGAAVLVNAGRTLALTIAGLQGGPEAIGQVHDALGLVSLGVLVVLTGLAGWAFRSLRVKAKKPRADTGASSVSLSLPIGSMAIILLALGGFILAHGWYWINEAQAEGQAGPALSLRDPAAAKPLSPRLQSGLDPTEGMLVRTVEEDGTVANGYHFFWSEDDADAEKFYHRPDVCMPGTGWELHGAIRKVRDPESGIQWLALPYELSGRKALLLWASWLDGEPMTFNLETGGTTQQKTLLSLVANGRRQFTFEVAALLVPYLEGSPPVEQALQIANGVFRTNDH